MKKRIISAAITLAFLPAMASAASALSGLEKLWTYNHASTGVAGQTSEIVAFDSLTNSLWVAGVAGVDVLHASNGSLIQHINTSIYGSINSVAIHNGVAAFAIENTTDRTQPGVVKLFDTSTRSLSAGVNSINVGALPDMLTFTHDGSKLLVANEGTPTNYSGYDPVGSVSIIDMSNRAVAATVNFNHAAVSGTDLRPKSVAGMDYEPEYIAVSKDGSKAFVSLQEANGLGVINLNTHQAEQVIGLGSKDFSQPGNYIDPSDRDGKIELRPVAARGLYQPDGIAAYESKGLTYLVLANEGDTREDEADKKRLGGAGDASRLNIASPDTKPGDVVTFGARSFSIRDQDGNLVFDSGNQLDAKAIALGIYDDGRSDDKGVEPEGVELLEINGRTIAFIGLERTLKSAIAVYDITDPTNVSYLDMIVTDGDLAPEGIKGYFHDGHYYLSIANEGTSTTSLYRLAAAVPEPSTWGMLLGGLGMMGWMGYRRRNPR
ncbi:choice-of-anchor I family protein [Methylobacillus gramineus]|uniref:choice-of-anchor I family protein n=1 Tax=Methylobacillus gramineus TaxID=755169 RepID=UPI001D0012ED|nr:choice-of-anchor I family protein [Methylobacillus gramineus]MCB5186049.1 choice-of-anchor I family protein [Methylobacillus gramineus]